MRTEPLHDDSKSEQPERNTPELTTPVMTMEDRPVPATKTDFQSQAQLCCHEQTKQQAVMLQKISFLEEQLRAEAEKAKMKDDQYAKMIEALQATADENMRQSCQRAETPETSGKKASKDWQELTDELNKKKEECNKLQEQLLEAELKADKVALEHKIQLQSKEDEVSEEKLKLRHKEAELRQAQALNERINEDMQAKIQEALDRQSDRLAKEKQQDLDSMNKRNEELIKQLVENHSAETRKLRELLLQQERKTRDADHVVCRLEMELKAAQFESNNRLDMNELEEMHAQS